MKKERYSLLDTLRGLTIISMVLFHGLWDLEYFGMVSKEVLYSDAAYIWQQSICWTFIFLSGFCFDIGKHHLKRGLMSLGGGIIITIVTCLFLYDARDIFGVLWFIGSATLLMILLDKLLGKSQNRIYLILGMIISLGLFLILRDINRGYLGFEGLDFYELPKGLYSGYVMTYLGFLSPDFYSSDYFSLIPWIFLYISGYYFRKLTKNIEGMEKVLKKYGTKWAEFLGRHSLIIYMLHQVVIYGFVYLLSVII